LTKFVIKGDVKEAMAGLKATLDAQDANFKASMNSTFKPAPPPQRAAAAPAAQPAAPSGFALGKTRSDRFSR